tara:strand:+ start:368 stop:727 length:360 start_codon:yes stop_codon:yes gene_type:complete
MVTIVGLENYKVYATHGAYDFEKNKSQPFIFSIWATLSNEGINDKLENTLNYANLQDAVENVVVNSDPVNLMETLCSNLVAELNSNLLISEIKIRVEKPNAPLPKEGGLAIVEHHWTRV